MVQHHHHSSQYVVSFFSTGIQTYFTVWMCASERKRVGNPNNNNDDTEWNRKINNTARARKIFRLTCYTLAFIVISISVSSSAFAATSALPKRCSLSVGVCVYTFSICVLATNMYVLFFSLYIFVTKVFNRLVQEINKDAGWNHWAVL